MVGATPIFVDIDDDLNINPNLIEDAISSRTKAIIPVHFNGHMCDMEQIQCIANKAKISVIEDAAQAFGASINGKKSGSFGDISCFSMNAMKVLHSYGEAGAVLTNNNEISNKVEILRYGGTVNREDCHYISLNFRLQTIQAALLQIELSRVDSIIHKRREVASFYNEQLRDYVYCPREKKGYLGSYYTYTIQTKVRDSLKTYLEERGIETKIYHPLLMPHHTAYKLNPNIPVAEKAVKNILSLPCHEKLTKEEAKYVADTVIAFFKLRLN
jgi:dTDP-4-amino-4,6-dideoxygalactose transaminase